MCGRYTNEAEFSEIRITFSAEPCERFGFWKPTYNITPSYGAGFEQLIVVGSAKGSREIRAARWWMIPPFWSKPLKALPTSFNARAEDIQRKPFWREAFRSKRCLVPATGWREFKGERGKKQPYHFRLPTKLFAFAGLWSTWTSPDGEVVDTFAIITTRPNKLAEPIHDRMPLVLPDEGYAAWLSEDASAAPVLEMAQAAAARLDLEVYPSDPIGNSGRFEGPEVVARLEPKLTTPVAVQQELFAKRRSC